MSPWKIHLVRYPILYIVCAFPVDYKSSAFKMCNLLLLCKLAAADALKADSIDDL
jgi:hypothetical protein